jgi:ABC-type amino acid transport substrate-binding protein
VLLGYVQKNRGAYKVVGRPFTEEPYGIGLKKGDSQFRAFLNDVLEQMYRDGSLEDGLRRHRRPGAAAAAGTTPRRPVLTTG